MVLRQVAVDPYLDESLRSNAYKLVCDVDCSKSLKDFIEASKRLQQDVEALLQGQVGQCG